MLRRASAAIAGRRTIRNHGAAMDYFRKLHRQQQSPERLQPIGQAGELPIAGTVAATSARFQQAVDGRHSSSLQQPHMPPQLQRRSPAAAETLGSGAGQTPQSAVAAAQQMAAQLLLPSLVNKRKSGEMARPRPASPSQLEVTYSVPIEI